MSSAIQLDLSAVISQGHFGTAYRGKKGERPVALKCLKAESGGEEELRREESLKRCTTHCPHVRESSGPLFIVMDLYEGSLLGRRLGAQHSILAL